MTSKKAAVLGILVLVVVSIGMWFTAVRVDPDAPKDLRGQSEISVVLTEAGFEPRRFRIDRDTTVIFSTTRGRPFWPASNLHPTHNIYSEFDPKRPLASEEAWSFRFEKEGEWGFHDHIRSYFSGVIYVGP